MAATPDPYMPPDAAPGTPSPLDALLGPARPLRIGHMGAGGLAPGNSLASIEAAFRHGVDLVELDVWRTADGALVLAHFNWLPPDPRPSGQSTVRDWARALRTWRAWPRVTRLTLQELRRLPIPPPTLAEALDLMRGRALPYLDLRSDGMAAELCVALRAGAPDGALLGAGPQRSFRAEHALMPELPATSGIAVPLLGGALSPSLQARLATASIARARRVGATGLSIEYHLAKPTFMAACRRAGLFVFAWTVDDPAAMRRLIAAGVDGITTNRPDRLATVLAERIG